MKVKMDVLDCNETGRSLTVYDGQPTLKLPLGYEDTIKPFFPFSYRKAVFMLDANNPSSGRG